MVQSNKKAKNVSVGGGNDDISDILDDKNDDDRGNCRVAANGRRNTSLLTSAKVNRILPENSNNEIKNKVDSVFYSSNTYR